MCVHADTTRQESASGGWAVVCIAEKNGLNKEAKDKNKTQMEKDNLDQIRTASNQNKIKI